MTLGHLIQISQGQVTPAICVMSYNLQKQLHKEHNICKEPKPHVVGWKQEDRNEKFQFLLNYVAEGELSW